MRLIRPEALLTRLAPATPLRLPRPAEVGPYAAGAVLCLCALVAVLKLWQVDLSVPLYMEGDVLLSQLFVKNTLETGWYTTNPRGGVPYGLILYDFPLAEESHMLLIRGIGACSGNLFRVVNCFYLLGFVLSTVSTVFTLRWFGVRALPAVVAGVLFAFLPYHFWRTQGHLFLAAYYTIPPTVLVAAWLLEGALPGSAGDPWRGRRRLTALVTAAVISSAGVYYAFFGCYLFAVAGVGGAWRTGRVRSLAAAAGLIAVVTAGLGLSASSSYRYTREHGKNPLVATRVSAEAEMYGFHIGQMILPRFNHRSEAVRELKQAFISAPGRAQPYDFGGAVGGVGLIGLAAVVGAALFRRPVEDRTPVLGPFGALAIAMIALGTIGGLGSLFAFFVTAKIRSYERVSIFVAFLGLAGSAVLLDRLLARAGSGWRLWAARGVCVAALAAGLWDQTTPLDVPPHAKNAVEHHHLNRFVAEMEAALPPGGMVFQLPFVDFPERPAVVQTTCYDHLRLLLRSRSLRFSHGRVPGRPGAENLASVSQLPADRMADVLVLMGFTGVHIDRQGYADRGAQLEAQFRAILGVAPVECRNGRDLFFPLTGLRDRLLGRLSPADLAVVEAQVRYPLDTSWKEPFGGMELIPGRQWRWCVGPAGEVIVGNPGREPVAVTFAFKVITPHPLAQPVPVRVSGVADGTFECSGGGTDCSVRAVVPPGRHTLRIECPAPAVPTPGRVIYFGLDGFRIRQHGLHPLVARARGEG